MKKIENALQGLEHIDNVHNLIVKSDNGQVVVGAHIVLKHQCTLEKHDEVCRFQVERMLKAQFDVNTSVLQIEASGCKHS